MLNKLKIYPILKAIVGSVKSEKVTIISTPTGSGKTLAVPITLSHCFEERVFVTVPRVLLAKQAMFSVIKLIIGEKLAHHVGCITGKFSTNPNANLVFCTERSFLNRISSLKVSDILVVDEIHEQGINTEEVIYAAKQHAANGGRVVLMSATMDCKKYAEYFGVDNCNIIELPETERQFKTTTIVCSPDNYLNKVVEIGGVTLIGVGGKADIEKETAKLRQLGYKAPIFSLHSEIEEDEEREILAATAKGIPCTIIATSVAMSGITFENLKVVVPPIYGKRIVDGKLCDYILSLAEAKQWEGRVGRTSDGIVLKIDSNIEREANPLPEILRVSLIDTVLSFLGNNVDLRNIQLLNQPSKDKVDLAFSVLEKSGLISDSKLTEKGKFIAKLGEGILSGNLLYEGEKLGIPAFAMKVAAVISNGNPLRKLHYRSKCSEINKDIATYSEHYYVVTVIENDEMLMPTFNVDLNNFCVKNNIFYKGVSKLRKDFKRIDKTYKDKLEVTLPLIQELLSKQLATNIFEYSWNETTRVVANMSSEKMFCTLSPVQLKRGMLAELTTVIK